MITTCPKCSHCWEADENDDEPCLQCEILERDSKANSAPPEIRSGEWMDALAQTWQWNLEKMQAEYDAGDRTPQKMGSMTRQKLCLDQFNAARKSASIGGGLRRRGVKR